MNREELNQAASDAFIQAQEGLAVPVDPDVASEMGAFAEPALTLDEIMEDVRDGNLAGMGDAYDE